MMLITKNALKTMLIKYCDSIALSVLLRRLLDVGAKLLIVVANGLETSTPNFVIAFVTFVCSLQSPHGTGLSEAYSHFLVYDQ